jgi:ATP-binding cassette subfamily G (WHITE) protein 2 (SNQ2)
MLTRARIMCHDNATRGLDSSTSLEYVQSLRVAADITKVTTVVSLYQAGESLWEEFDKVR